MTKPVVDFDPYSLEYAQDPLEFFRNLRDDHPLAWTDHYGGFWFTTRHAELFEAARDDETFSSRNGVFDGVECRGISILPHDYALIPIESDPPELHAYRVAMNRTFAPAAVNAMRPLMLRLVTWCIDQCITRGEVDLVEDLVGPVPAMITMSIVGLPLEDWEQCARPVHNSVAFGEGTPEREEAQRGLAQTARRMYDEVARRRIEPRLDLPTRLTRTEVDGRLLNDDEIVGILNTTIAAGVDTTTALLSHTLYFLNEHSELRAALGGDEALVSRLCEEMLRYHAPVPALSRTATRDTSLGGQEVRAGERVWLSWMGANHDPTVFERPDEVDLDRSPNRHIAFGVGAHRCLGSHLARATFSVVIPEIVRRMPDYVVDVDQATRYRSICAVNGWHRMPATFTPGSPIGPKELPTLDEITPREAAPAS